MKLFEVTVLVSGKRRPRVLGSWWGTAPTAQDAERLALADVWEPRFDDEGHPACEAREQARYICCESWYHMFAVGSQWLTRWVYDRVDDEIVVAELLWNAAGDVWMPVSAEERAHLREAVEGLGLDIDPKEFEGVAEADEVPPWALKALKHVLDQAADR